MPLTRCALSRPRASTSARRSASLRRVLLHRPDLELKRLTPRNKDELLFDDVLWVKRARQEHDAFADALAERGVEVLLPRRAARRRRSTTARRATRSLERDADAPSASGRRSAPDVARLARASCRPQELAERLIGGIAYDELPFASGALAAQVAARSTASCCAPLPNHLFTRDTSAWIYDGVSINAMAKPARRREAIHLRRDLPPPPAVRGAAHQSWSDDLGGPAQLEGGDVLVIGNGCVLVGMGERTRPGGVELLAGGCSRAGVGDARDRRRRCPRSARRCTSTR